MRRAFAFLTVIGSGRARRAAPPTPGTLRWFPLVGASIGAVVGATWWGAGRLWPPLVAAGLAVTADLVLTGLLHVDGLADSADGLLPPLPRDRRLEVMATPDVGAFGVAAVAGVLIVRSAALAGRAPSILLVAGLWCGARTLMVGAVTVLPYARGEGGLVAAFRGDGGGPVARAAPIVAGTAAAAVLAALGAGPAGALAVGVGLLGGIAVLAGAQRRIGGYTGDVLGAAGIIAESTGLLIAAARW